jgi:hypothetical protein
MLDSIVDCTCSFDLLILLPVFLTSEEDLRVIEVQLSVEVLTKEELLLLVGALVLKRPSLIDVFITLLGLEV